MENTPLADTSRAAVDSLRVAIILVNWNGWQDTIACLDSVAGMTHKNHVVFVVDNASSDGSVEKIREWCRQPIGLNRDDLRSGVRSGTSLRGARPMAVAEVDFNDLKGEAEIPAGTEIVLIRSGGNRGFAGGNNVGLKCAGLQNFDYFWLLNTDTLADSESLTELLNRAERDPKVGMVGSTLMFYWQPGVLQATGGAIFDSRRMQPRPLNENLKASQVDNDPTAVEAQMSYVVGASMLVSRRFVGDVGLMTEDYFLYFEEMDWAVRAAGRYTLGYAPRSVVHHKVGASSAKVDSFFSARIQYRNRVKFVARYFPSRFSVVVMRLMFDELPRHVLKRRWVHARALASSLGGVISAYREGVAGRPATYVEALGIQTYRQ